MMNRNIEFPPPVASAIRRSAWFCALLTFMGLPRCEAAGTSLPACDWVLVTEQAAFSPRDTSEGVVFKDKMWLSNGYLKGEALARDLWTSTDGRAWTLITTNTPYDGYAEMTVFDGKMWAIKDSGWNSRDGVNWNRVLEKTPFGGRGYGELVVHNGRMWQLGSSNDVWNTSDGVNWNCVTTNAAFGPRYASAVASFKGRLWVMGGATHRTNDPPEKFYPQFTTFNDVWSSPDGVEWTRVAQHAPWGPRMWFVPMVYADRLWIIGGFDNARRENSSEVWWTADGDIWRILKTKTKISPRHEVTAYVYDRHLWVVAGNRWPLTNDVFKLTPPLERRRR